MDKETSMDRVEEKLNNLHHRTLLVQQIRDTKWYQFGLRKLHQENLEYLEAKYEQLLKENHD